MNDRHPWIVTDVPTSALGAVAEFRVFAIEEESLIKSADTVNHLAPDEHERTADPIDIANGGAPIPGGVIRIGPGEQRRQEPGETETGDGQTQRIGEPPGIKLDCTILVEQQASSSRPAKALCHYKHPQLRLSSASYKVLTES